MKIDSLAYGGNGVARLDGFVLFVRRGLPGDSCARESRRCERSHAEALAVEVVEPGADRVEAPCDHYPACGGCRFQDLAYDVQLEQKAAQVRDALVRLGRIAEPPLEPPSRPSRSSTTATSSSTRLHRGPTGPCSASTEPGAGTRCSTSASAG